MGWSMDARDTINTGCNRRARKRDSRALSVCPLCSQRILDQFLAGFLLTPFAAGRFLPEACVSACFRFSWIARSAAVPVMDEWMNQAPTTWKERPAEIVDMTSAVDRPALSELVRLPYRLN